MEEGLLLNNAPSIYIADDDDDDVYFVRAALKELDAGISLRRFINGKQLLQQLTSENNLPNLILLDLNMPVLDGRETLKSIRENYGAQLPVIILSTSNHQHEKELCHEYGANSYFTKPCNFPLYKEIMKKLKSQWLDAVSVTLK